MKKTMTTIAASVLLLMGGCAKSEPLTKQEYFDEITKLVYVHNSAIIEIATPLYEYEMNDIPFDEDALRVQAQKIEDALEQIIDLTPPSEYSEYHDKICDGVDSKLLWLEALDDVLGAKDKEEFKLAADVMVEVDMNSTFLSAWSEFVISVSGEVEIDFEKLGLN